MKIKVNGREMDIDAGAKKITAAFLLETLKIKFKVVVEKNGIILDPEKYSSEELHEGDVFEIVQFVGGG